jgi:hypothetical protein
MLEHNGLCSLALEPVVCLASRNCTQDEDKRREMLRLLGKAAAAPTQPLWKDAILEAALFSDSWNHRSYELRKAVKKCDWHSAQGFVFKARLWLDGSDLRAFGGLEAEHGAVSRLLISRNAVEQVVSDFRMYKGKSQFR